VRFQEKGLRINETTSETDGDGYANVADVLAAMEEGGE
jgi:hypothetical protein